MPEDNFHRGGGNLPAGSHLQYHNVYGFLMVKASRAGIEAVRPEKRPFILTRSNFWEDNAMQQLGPGITAPHGNI